MVSLPQPIEEEACLVLQVPLAPLIPSGISHLTPYHPLQK